ncbi:putative nucleoside-diphosphate sugar epimerase [Synechococcus sp. PCC 7502]|uniref:NAD(P)H-binding protein n=1 Tax=Synechococcus sp. PCC 7502 TaxID=1173263 RepID=UPI00029FED5A|nr:NmrA family NAD(P)-binding protein [Synechococcus sp. PCC 7502]AFY73169.1 putative nucleoside-diphosphate sugar epimerase [Synechococcus sp. PCC 7502]
MTLLIVGATGTLGRQITRHALDQGLKVKCLVRNPQKAAFLKEWGADLVIGNLTKPETLTKAIEGTTMIIDAATTRATDSARIKKVDWEGKVALIQAAEKAQVERFIFFSILNAEKYPKVPLMDIKNCTEKFLAQTGLNYTILRPCGFFQNLISEYAIPMLENQTIWVGAEDAPIAYMNTQDIAKFAIAALSSSEATRQTLPIAGLKAWAPSEIIRQCERFSGRTARTARMPLGAVRFARNLALWFEGGWSFAERVAYVEVQASGMPVTADMTETYRILGIDPEQITTLESYLQEYFGRILRKLKELDYKEPKVKSTF